MLLKRKQYRILFVLCLATYDINILNVVLLN